MKRVAVFGNAGGGKWTLAKKMAAATGLPLYPLDLIQWKVGGVKVPHEQYLEAHAELLQREAWIIDGYGCRKSAWERFAVADTLVYIDLPLPVHYLWVTKRLFTGMFKTPEGWPEGSPVLSSTITCYRTVWLCHRYLTPDYRKLVAETAATKRIHHLKSATDMKRFLAEVTPRRG